MECEAMDHSLQRTMGGFTHGIVLKLNKSQYGLACYGNSVPIWRNGLRQELIDSGVPVFFVQDFKFLTRLWVTSFFWHLISFYLGQKWTEHCAPLPACKLLFDFNQTWAGRSTATFSLSADASEKLEPFHLFLQNANKNTNPNMNNKYLWF